MSFEVILSPLAAENVEQAIQYYLNDVSPSVALNFLDEYHKIKEILEKNPFFQFHDNHYRFLPFKKFPYIAFFILHEPSKTVFLNSIFHTSQNPSKFPKH
jgi:plasmid stabilization system protein ParE